MEKSLICPLSNGEKDRVRALKESENFAEYAEIGAKDALHMTLLSEELLCMAGTVLDTKNGEFWIEKDEKTVELHLATKSKLTEAEKEVLVNVSKGKENAAYKGMTGLFKKVFDILTDENAFMEESLARLDFDAGFTMKMGGVTAEECKEWSLKALKEQEKFEKWDELEVSVLSKLSEDIIVSVRNEKAEITVKMLLS